MKKIILILILLINSNISFIKSEHIPNIPIELKPIIISFLDCPDIKSLIKNIYALKSVNKEFNIILNNQYYLNNIIFNYLSRHKDITYFSEVIEMYNSIKDEKLIKAIQYAYKKIKLNLDYEQINKGTTLLIDSIIEKNIKKLEFLLKAGANPNFRLKDHYTHQYRNSPLHYAIHSYDLNILERLLNAGADPNILGFNQQTPLLDAISCVNNESINILLKYGADINISNQYGISPLSLANSPANKKILDIFRSFFKDKK